MGQAELNSIDAHPLNRRGRPVPAPCWRSSGRPMTRMTWSSWAERKSSH